MLLRHVDHQRILKSKYVYGRVLIGCRIVFGSFFASGFGFFLLSFPVPFALYLQQFGTRTCHFAWYLLHIGMVTLHFASYLLHLDPLKLLQLQPSLGTILEPKNGF